MSRLIRESDVQDMLDDAQCISDGEYSYVCTEDIKLPKLPTVDAVPVVHAHWIMYSYDEAICSHCGYDRGTEFECTSEAKERWGELPMYCENCGAKMDGKRKDIDRHARR